MNPRVPVTIPPIAESATFQLLRAPGDLGSCPTPGQHCDEPEDAPGQAEYVPASESTPKVSETTARPLYRSTGGESVSSVMGLRAGDAAITITVRRCPISSM